jgi:hypothetical protein
MGGVPFEYFVFGHYSEESRRGEARDGYRQFDEALARAQRLCPDRECTDVAIVRFLEKSRKALIAVLKGVAWPYQTELQRRSISFEVRNMMADNKWPFSESDEASPPPVTGTHPAITNPRPLPA